MSRSRVRVYLGCSLDGCVAGPDHDLSFLTQHAPQPDVDMGGGLGFEDFLGQVGAQDILSAVKKHQCYRILVDYRGIELIGTVTKIYDVPKKVSKALSKAGLRSHAIKRALVVSGYIEGFRFLETVSITRGQPLRIFQDIDEAKKWLTEEE